MYFLLAIIVILILVAFYILPQSSEHFDVYYNNDRMAANYGYDSLDTKYRWKDKDADGQTIYDKVYNSTLTPAPSNKYNLRFADAPMYNPTTGIKDPMITDPNSGETMVLSQKNA
jgi:hypothetical protein